MDLAGGAWIFAAVILIFTIAVIYGLYTRKGSGISQRPYGKVYGGAPGAKEASVLDHDRAAADGLSGREARLRTRSQSRWSGYGRGTKP